MNYRNLPQCKMVTENALFSSEHLPWDFRASVRSKTMHSLFCITSQELPYTALPHKISYYHYY